MFGTLFLLLQSKSKYYAILGTLFCVRWLILLMIGHFMLEVGRCTGKIGYTKRFYWYGRQRNTNEWFW